MLVDSHCHLTDAQFAGDLDAVVARARANGLVRILTLGTDIPSGEAAIALADRYPEVYAAVGIHPESVRDALDTELTRIRALAQHPRVRAIGEIGLDYYWDRTTIELQSSWFDRQMELAAELDLPVCIHDRDAHVDVLAALRRAKARWPQLRGVLHAFSGDEMLAAAVNALGFKVGFGGPITFKNARRTAAVAQAVPLGEILIETDSPYLAPHPWRGRRNEPAHVASVAERLAELKGLAVVQVQQRTTENARELFRW